MKIKFGTFYNEFKLLKADFRFTDIFGIWIMNFPILICRKYEFMDGTQNYPIFYSFGFLGFYI